MVRLGPAIEPCLLQLYDYTFPRTIQIQQDMSDKAGQPHFIAVIVYEQRYA